MKHPTVNDEPVLVGNWIDVDPPTIGGEVGKGGVALSGVVIEIRMVRGQDHMWIETHTGRNCIITPDMVVSQRTLSEEEQDELIQAEHARWMERYGGE